MDAVWMQAAWRDVKSSGLPCAENGKVRNIRHILPTGKGEKRTTWTRKCDDLGPPVSLTGPAGIVAIRHRREKLLHSRLYRWPGREKERKSEEWDEEEEAGLAMFSLFVTFHSAVLQLKRPIAVESADDRSGSHRKHTENIHERTSKHSSTQKMAGA